MSTPKSVAVRAAYTCATWFGSGNSTLAPGTAGSLATLPLVFLLRRASPLSYAVTTLALTAIGVWASQLVADDLGEADPGRVVIDEVAGVLISMGLVRRRSLAVQLSAFALFRALDIMKPGPISRAEKLEPAGVGIMADDVLAGLLAGALARWL